MNEKDLKAIFDAVDPITSAQEDLDRLVAKWNDIPCIGISDRIPSM